jgi:transposase
MESSFAGLRWGSITTTMKHIPPKEVKPPSAFCGIDIAKRTFVAALDDAADFRRSPTAKFPNDHDGFSRLLDWLFARVPEDAVVRISMEATGIHWLALASHLREHARLVVCVHNPGPVKKYILGFGLRAKTDAIDAALLACFARERARVAWLPAPAVQARLANLARTYDDIKVQEGAFAARSEDCRCKESKVHLDAVLRTLRRELEKLVEEMKDLVASDETLAARSALLQTVPGIAELSAAQLLAEMPPELIASPRAMSAYAGVVPQVEISGDSVHSSRLCRQGNKHLQKRLFRAAVSASAWCPELRAFRERLVSKGKPKMRAITAVSHKLLRALCVMLVENKPFDPRRLAPTA